MRALSWERQWHGRPMWMWSEWQREWWADFSMEIREALAPAEPLFDDLRYLAVLLPQGREKRLNTLNEYRDRWISAMMEEPVEHRQQNVGRRLANEWLRLKTLSQPVTNNGFRASTGGG